MRTLGITEEQMERLEIEDVVYYSAPTVGLSLLTSDDRVFAIQLRAAPADRERNRMPLPRALEFHMRRSEVVALLGEPHKRGSAREFPILGKMPAWDLFHFDRGEIHVEYEMDESSIRMITLTRKRSD